MQQQKQIIEYWFQTNLFNSVMLVRIKMMERDEEKAKELFERKFHPMKCSVIEEPTAGKVMVVQEVWEL